MTGAPPGRSHHASERRAELLGVGRSLLMDRVTAEVVEALRAEGVPSVVLKGASLAGWLYPDATARPYSDSDLLLPAGAMRSAGAVLERLGFEPERRESEVPAHWSMHAFLWQRDEDLAYVDLHVSLQGIGAPPERAWEVLSGASETMPIGGVEAQVLTPPARALHVALHAAHNGAPGRKSLEDVERAVGQLSEGTWLAAATLAGELDATAAFAAGIRLASGGPALATRLQLAGDGSVEMALHARLGHPEAVAAGAYRNTMAITIERFRRARGAAPKGRFVLGALAPSAAYMRSKFPVARRGPGGLALAYAHRLLLVARDLPPGFLAWRRAAREVTAERRARKAPARPPPP